MLVLEKILKQKMIHNAEGVPVKPGTCICWGYNYKLE